MNTIKIENGLLVVVPEGPLQLPALITRDLLQAIFDVDDPARLGHLSDIHRRISDADKDRFRQNCAIFGDPFSSLLELASMTWASVGGKSGIWDLRQFHICFREVIDSWLVREVVVTEQGVWFIIGTGPRCIWTRAEFEYKFGQTLQEHLRSYVAFRDQICKRVMTTIVEGMVEVEVQLELEDGRMLLEKRRGPIAIPVKQWTFRAGEKFVTTIT